MIYAELRNWYGKWKMEKSETSKVRRVGRYSWPWGWRQGDTGGLFNIELKVIYEQLEIGYVE